MAPAIGGRGIEVSGFTETNGIQKGGSSMETKKLSPVGQVVKRIMMAL